MPFSNPYDPSDPQHYFFQNLPRNDAAEARLDAAQADQAREASESWQWILQPQEQKSPQQAASNHTPQVAQREAMIEQSTSWTWILPESERRQYAERKRQESQQSDSMEGEQSDSVEGGWQYRSDQGVVEVVELEDDEIPPRQRNAQY